MKSTALALPDLPGMEAFLQAMRLPDKAADERIEEAYALAYRLTQLGQHQQAGRLFCLLCLYRQRDVRFWHGAALCARQLKDYPMAVRAYLQCLMVAPDDNRFAFDVVDCLCLAGERPAALDLLQEMARTARRSGDEDHAERAERVLVRLQGETHELVA